MRTASGRRWQCLSRLPGDGRSHSGTGFDRSQIGWFVYVFHVELPSYVVLASSKSYTVLYAHVGASEVTGQEGMLANST
eukprot:1408936-Pleurochrysis_carterae.AAC.1